MGLGHAEIAVVLGIIYAGSKTKRVLLFRAKVMNCITAVPTPCLYLLALLLSLRCLAGMNCGEECW